MATSSARWCVSTRITTARATPASRPPPPTAKATTVCPTPAASPARPLLVTVTPQTKDLTRGQGYTFPATFTMSQIVTDAGQQNITPLSTLVTAQMQAGLSQAQATAAVQSMPGGIDPNADYVASGDSTALAKAIAIVG